MSAVLLTASNLSVAQWVQTKAPMRTTVLALAFTDSILFAGTFGSGIFYSTDNGSAWISVDSGQTYMYVRTFAIKGTIVFAGTYNGVFVSTNGGKNWSSVSSGLFPLANIYSLVVERTNLFAATNGGVFLSTNEGASWAPVNSGFPPNPSVFSLVIRGTDLIAGVCSFDNSQGGCTPGVYRSNTDEIHWAYASSGLSIEVESLALLEPNLYAGTYGHGIFVSTDNGTDWTPVSSGLVSHRYIYTFAVCGTNLFAATDSGVFQTSNNGATWMAVNSGLTNLFVTSLAVNGAYLFAGTNDNGVWRRLLSEITAIHDAYNEIPSQFELDQNYPNPFNPSTSISYILPSRARVMVQVYNPLGMLITTLVNEDKPPGRYTVMWEANARPSGLYFYRMKAGGFVQTKKAIILK